jgi:hypothetical protein
MKVVMTKLYRQNRERIPADELRQYDGQWVAFSADGRRIVASGDSIGQVSVRLDASREDIQDVILERIEFDNDDVEVGGAELL